MKSFIAAILFLGVAGDAHGFDADLPERKTIEWTIEMGKPVIPEVDFEKAPASKVIEFMVPANGVGFFVKIDTSAVKSRLNRTLTIHERKMPWMLLLGRVADNLDADIVIGEGVFKLVPRKK